MSKELPDQLPLLEVIVEMDYLPAGGWWIAQNIDPVSWLWQGRGDTAEAACDLAYAAAVKHFGQELSMLYRYTDAGIKQSKIEDADNPMY